MEQTELFEKTEKVEVGRKQSGISTSDLTLSAYTNDNEYLFPQILDLHVPKNAIIADITFGKGVFWNRVNLKDYELHASDLFLKEETLKKFRLFKVRQQSFSSSNIPCTSQKVLCSSMNYISSGFIPVQMTMSDREIFE